MHAPLGPGGAASPHAPNSLILFGFMDFSNLSRSLQFLVLAVGIFASYLAYGLTQEYLIATWRAEGRVLMWYMNLAQSTTYVVLITLMKKMTQPLSSSALPSPSKRTKEEILSLLIIGGLGAAAMGLSNVALETLSYPTQVAFKSSKPIPVHIVGAFVLNKAYALHEWCATLMLSVGLILFAWEDSEKTAHFSPIGVWAVTTALVLDGFVGNLQQKTFAKTAVTPIDMILYSKITMMVVSFLACLLNGQLAFAVRHASWHSFFALTLFSVSGLIGENFVVTMIQKFGALPTVILTSIRKCLTVALSFVFFARPATPNYLLASALVAIGVGIHVAADHQRHKSKHELADAKASELSEKLVA